MIRQGPGTANVWVPSANLSRLHAVRSEYGVIRAGVALCGREIPLGMARMLGQSPPKCRHCLKRIGEAS